MTGVVIFCILALVLLVYVFWARAWLRGRYPGFDAFIVQVEPIERTLWAKSRTVLLARLTWLGAMLVSIHDGLAAFMTNLDLTPLTDRILAFVSPDLRPLLIGGAITALGIAFDWLRHKSDTPLEVEGAN